MCFPQKPRDGSTQLQAVLDSLEVYPKESLTIVRWVGFVFLPEVWGSSTAGTAAARREGGGIPIACHILPIKMTEQSKGGGELAVHS